MCYKSLGIRKSCLGWRRKKKRKNNETVSSDSDSQNVSYTARSYISYENNNFTENDYQRLKPKKPHAQKFITPSSENVVPFASVSYIFVPSYTFFTFNGISVFNANK